MSHADHRLIRADRSGFALPMSILVIGFLTATVMAAFARTGAEIRTVDNQQAQQHAFALANAGLENFMSGNRFGRNRPDTFVVANVGHAVVRVDTVRRATLSGDTSMYLVHSRAVLGGSGAGRPRATRVVAQFAERPPTKIQVLSSWTSLSGLIKNGSSGVITGHDACAGSSTVLPGVALPDGGYTQQGSGNVVAGNPPVEEMGTQTEMASQINIDWNGIRDPISPTITPDIVVCKPGTYGYDAARGPCGSFPTASTFTNNPNYWPVIVINGSSSLPANGRGFLIVTGDLTFGGGDKWDGIVMVGGKIVDNGSGNIAGAVISGLNVLLGETVGESSVANGTKDYYYDSCKVASAAAGAGRLYPIQNAWSDTWLTW
jgi:hypothetical protein